MNSIKVGEVYDGIAMDGVGSKIGIFDHSFMLVASVPNSSQQFIEDFQQRAFELSLTVKDGIMFLMYRFGRADWSDATFDVHCYDNFNFKDFDTSRLVAFLCDADTKKLRAISVLKPTPDFSRALTEEIERQVKEQNFDSNQYISKIHAIFETYSSEDLTKFSHASCKCHTISTDELTFQTIKEVRK